VTSVASPEEVVNLALQTLGYPEFIGSLFEGSVPARAGLQFYAQTRDELLRETDWPFARQAVTMALLKTAPPGGYGITPWNPATNPPLPWIYEYSYPSGCIEMRSVRPLPIVIPNYDPKPNIFVVASDTQTNLKVVLTNLINATAVFTGQVTDPTQWESLFVDSLVQRLARKMAPGLAAKPNVEKDEQAEEATTGAQADAHRG
jgi:hypothetical protein